MKRKWIALTLACMMTASVLAGCGSSSGGEKETTATKTNAEASEETVASCCPAN